MQVGRKFSEKHHGAKYRPVHGLTARGVQNPIEWIRRLAAALIQEGCLEQRIGDAVASSNRSLGAELFQTELLDRIVENPVPHADAGPARTARQLCQHAIFPTRAPIQPQSRSKTFVIGIDQAVWHSLVSWNYESRGLYTCVVAVRTRHAQALKKGHGLGRQLAWENRGKLAGVKCLYFLADVRQRSIQLPAQTVVQRYVGLDLPAILREAI